MYCIFINCKTIHITFFVVVLSSLIMDANSLILFVIKEYSPYNACSPLFEQTARSIIETISRNKLIVFHDYASSFIIFYQISIG